MKTRRTKILKVLLAIVPALLLALVLQPAAALADSYKVTIQCNGNEGSLDFGSVTTTSYTQDADADYDYMLQNIPTPSPNSYYVFVYWTADTQINLYPEDIQNPPDPIPANTAFTTQQLSQAMFQQETTVTAHFRSSFHTVTYDSEDVTRGWITYSGWQGVVIATETVVDDKCPTFVDTDRAGEREYAVHAEDGWEFSYWTTTVDVTLANGGGTIEAGQPISQEQMLNVMVESNLTFVAHFKQPSVDPDPDPDPVDPVDPDTPDGSDSQGGADIVKPVSDSGAKVLPKTADALPAATTAVALGAGVVVAGAVLLRKRCQ